MKSKQHKKATNWSQGRNEKWNVGQITIDDYVQENNKDDGKKEKKEKLIPVASEASEEVSHPSEQNGRKRASGWLCPNALLIVLLVVNERRGNPRQHGIERRVR